jgi:hypothetical protein
MYEDLKTEITVQSTLLQYFKRQEICLLQHKITFRNDTQNFLFYFAPYHSTIMLIYGVLLCSSLQQSPSLTMPITTLRP